MTNVQRRQREKERRRNDIVDAAEGLFFSRGYDNVTMDDIAAKVELNKATIYLYFENKESLFFAIVLRGVRMLNEKVEERQAKGGPGIDRLWEVWRSYGDHVKDHPDHFRAYMLFRSGRFGLDKMVDVDMVGKTSIPGFSSRTIFNVPNGTLVEDILYQHRKVFEAFLEAAKRGSDDGSICSDLDPTEIAGLLMLLAESSFIIDPLISIEMGERGITKGRFLRDLPRFLALSGDRSLFHQLA